MSARKIAVLTTSRADYGLLYWIMRRIRADRGLRLQVLATGAHLSRAFGRTVDKIVRDGFDVSARVPLLAADDSGRAAGRALARGMAGFVAAFDRLKPNILLVLGDRLELMPAATAAVALRIPIAHLHGGESSEGALDEQVRHAVTKLAHLHFVAAEPYRRRVIRMGEMPGRVFNVGAPGLEFIRHLRFLTRRDLENILGLSLRPPLALATLHPETASARRSDSEALDELFAALDQAGATVVFTYSNSDPGGRALNRKIRDYAAARQGRVAAAASLGQQAYLSLARVSDVVIGNSSSGIIEIPSLRRPTVNIGTRQDGRLRAPSIIDCRPNRQAIGRALQLALSADFKASRCTGKSPYGDGETSTRVVSALKATALEKLLRKKFHDS